MNATVDVKHLACGLTRVAQTKNGVKEKAIDEPRTNSLLRSRDHCCFVHCHTLFFDPRPEHVRLSQRNRKETIGRRYRQYLRIGPQMRARKNASFAFFGCPMDDEPGGGHAGGGQGVEP